MIFSFAEILQDTFFIKLLLDIKRTVKNKEAKLYLVEFIKDISSVCLYEMSLFLDEAGILKKKDFYRSNGLKTVREHREWIKRKVIGSTTIQQKIKDMGINFSSKTYDLNIVIKYGKLLSFNFENYDCRDELAYLNDILSIIEATSKIILEGLQLDGETVEKIYAACLDEFRDVIDKCSRQLSGKRYSYSTYKLFLFHPSLTIEDKSFILQRYRLVASILKMDRLFAGESIEFEVDGIKFGLQSFFRKYKSLVIDMLGKDLQQPTTYYLSDLKSAIDEQIIGSFFPLNRKQRDNCHYTKISTFTLEEQKCLDKYQNKYLNLVLKSFCDVMYIKVDEKDIRATKWAYKLMKSASRA